MNVWLVGVKPAVGGQANLEISAFGALIVAVEQFICIANGMALHMVVVVSQKRRRQRCREDGRWLPRRSCGLLLAGIGWADWRFGLTRFRWGLEEDGFERGFDRCVDGVCLKGRWRWGVAGATLP